MENNSCQINQGGRNNNVSSMQKKIKFENGIVFAVPLSNSEYGIGMVTKKYKRITIGYFFKIIFSKLPGILSKEFLCAENVILIAQFSSLGIENGEWPLVKSNFIFNSNEWPMPLFKMQHPITEQYFAVEYDETLLNDRRFLISKEVAKNLYGDGLFGYGALEKELDGILKNSNPTYL